MKRAIWAIAAAYLTWGWATPSLAQSTITRSSSFGYDATSGLLTQEIVEPGTPALKLETDYTYDAFGNKVSVTVSGNGVTSRNAQTGYSANGQFQTSATNALSQSESYQYDVRFGKPTSHTGPNGLTTTVAYDSFGRKTQETRADGTLTKWTYQFCSGVNGGTATCVSGASYLINETPYASDGTTANGPVVSVYYDSLDREIARETQGFDGSIVRGTRQYDALGRVLNTSRPFFASGGTAQLTTYTYDALGRVLTETRPDSSVSQTAYHGLSVTETNALNQTRIVVKNSQGQIITVTDALGKTMLFAYDAVGNLVQTTDSDTNAVTATYDLRGRKTTSSDPDLGTWGYSYNVFGELTSQSDAKGQQTAITYDNLGRMTQRTEADMTSVWTYDTATHGIGKLASSGITAGNGNGFGRTLSYDALGRPSQVATTIDGNTYAMSAVYDANSRLNKVVYPSGFTARYSYNALGYANQLADDATSLVHWTANTMDAEAHLTQVTAGNGLVTTRSFNVTNGRLTSIATGAGSAVQNFAYTYDLLGNPLSRSDANTSMSENFVYDALNRLTSAVVNLSPTPLSKSFTYSPIGNILSKSDVGTYNYNAPGSAQPHAVMSTSGGTISTTFTYDPNGNQTAGLGRTITWTSYNKPASITQGTRTINFLDDTEHQRFKQIAPEGTTLYIAGFGVLAEIANPGTTSATWTEYLSVGNAKVGMRVLQVSSQTLSTRYFLSDHLGSVSVITDENGLVVQRLSYDAWGKRRNPDGTDDTTGSITSPTTRGFTGEEMLSVGGLVHLNGRVYDPLLARMTSADPTVTDPTNPQGWNRYSYVGNDPLAFTDPNGFSWLSSAFHSIGHAVSNFFHSVVNFLRQNFMTILQMAMNVVLTPFIGPFAAAAISAAIVTGISGGSFSQMLKAAAIAGATAFAFNVVGAATNAVEGLGFDLSAQHLQPEFGSEAYAFNVAGHAAVGCASAVASGNSCKAGALSGAAGAAVAPWATKASFSTGLVISSVAGGVASVAGGGKFANGALTAGFGYMFNAAAGRFIGGMVGGGLAGLLGIESGPGAIVAAYAGRLVFGAAGSALEDWLFNQSVEPEKLVEVQGTDEQWGQKFGQHGPEYGFSMDRDGLQEYKTLANTVRNDPNAIVTNYSSSSPVYPGETQYQVGNNLLRLDQNGLFRSLYSLR